jgi:hypothetical protein
MEDRTFKKVEYVSDRNNIEVCAPSVRYAISIEEATQIASELLQAIGQAKGVEKTRDIDFEYRLGNAIDGVQLALNNLYALARDKGIEVSVNVRDHQKR